MIDTFVRLFDSYKALNFKKCTSFAEKLCSSLVKDLRKHPDGISLFKVDGNVTPSRISLAVAAPRRTFGDIEYVQIRGLEVRESVNVCCSSCAPIYLKFDKLVAPAIQWPGTTYDEEVDNLHYVIDNRDDGVVVKFAELLASTDPDIISAFYLPELYENSVRNSNIPRERIIALNR